MKRIVIVVLASAGLVVGASACAPPQAPSGGPSCNPNYSGCVPNTDDVDSAGGSGNGAGLCEWTGAGDRFRRVRARRRRRRCRLRVVAVDAKNPTVGPAATRGRNTHA